MSGARQPIDVVKGKGKKHLTKEEIAFREQMELKVETKDIIAPKYLPAKLKREFIVIKDRLLEIGIITDLDADLLARHLMSKYRYLDYTKRLDVAMANDDLKSAEKLISFQDRAFKQCTITARDLGLTISSRCKLVMPTKEVVKKENKYNELLEEL